MRSQTDENRRRALIETVAYGRQLALETEFFSHGEPVPGYQDRTKTLSILLCNSPLVSS
jgi:hypothetical protein